MSERRDLESALKQEKIRKWEVFPGRNKFCCNGRIMLATQAGILYFTIFLIVATTGCFGLDAYYIWQHIHPILPILAVIQFIFVLSALCRTAFGDPGILPRATPAEAEAIEKLIAEETNVANNKGSLPYRPPPRVKDVIINGQEFKLKYCFTCKIFRPPRASHCSVCDNCVDRFDHHCPWVGNCVGRRNYKYFYLFLASLTVYCAYLLSLSVTCIVLRTNKDNFLSAMQQGPLSPVVVLIAFFSIWSVAGLAGFHSLLTARNMTTNEDIKGSYKDGEHGNPFSAGSCFANCALVLCGPLPPSLIDRTGFVNSEDLPVIAPPTAPPSWATSAQGNSSASAQNVLNLSNGSHDSANFLRVSQESSSQLSANKDDSESNTPSKSRDSDQQRLPKYLPPIEHVHHSSQSNVSKEYLT